MKFSEFTPEIKSAPLLGEHTDEVLRELGYTAQQIAELHKKKAVGSTGIESLASGSTKIGSKSTSKSNSKEPVLSTK